MKMEDYGKFYGEIFQGEHLALFHFRYGFGPDGALLMILDPLAKLVH